LGSLDDYVSDNISELGVLLLKERGKPLEIVESLLGPLNRY
jgi:hypothetical protein